MNLRFKTRSAHALTVAATVAATSLVPIFTGTAHAAPDVGAGGPFAYTEQEPAISIGTDASVGGGNFYDGRYLDVEIDSAGASESLGLQTVSTPSTADGVVSVVGTAVYVGDGSSATPIGSVDAVFDGRDGRKLRINFGSDFRNAGFETGNIEPWTAIESMVELGVTEIAGFTTVDTATYPPDSGGDGDVPTSSTFVVATTDDIAVAPTEGDYALGLTSDMWTLNSCDVVHGPAAYSAAFDAVIGQQLSFDWRAFSGNDAYAVFGYLLNTTTGEQIEVLDEYTTDVSGTTPWTTVNVAVPTTSTYRFVFVSGSYDGTCGLLAGASLYVDNFRVVSSEFVNDAMVTDVMALVTYENDSDDPAAVRTVTMTVEDTDGDIDSASATINIAAVNDPAVGTPVAQEWLNNPGDDTFADIVGTLGFVDPDSPSLTYGIQGGTPGSYSVGGSSYDVRVTGPYADLYVDSSTGDYRLVADDAAIEAVSTPDVDVFTVTADDGDDVATTTVSLGITVPPSPQNVAGAPGDGEITVTWDQPFDTTGVTGYTATASPGGQSCTTVAVDATSCVISGLTNGTEYTVVVTPNTASGPSTDSLASQPVTPVGPPTAPVSVVATPADGRVLLEWDAPTSDGGSEITGYTVTTAPGGATCTTTGATSCTVLGLAAGVDYTFTVTATNAEGTGPSSSATPARVLTAATTTLVASEPQIDDGDEVTLTATVTGDSPTGTVEFFDGTTSLGTAAIVGGVATLVVDDLPTGTRELTATYSGDADHYADTSPEADVAVRTISAMGIETDTNTSTEGETVVLTATIDGDSPTGTVEFFDGATSLGTATVVDGVAVLEVDDLPIGDRTITATYSGDSLNTGVGAASALDVTVLTDAEVVLTVSPERPGSGEQVVLTATIDGDDPSGTVDFFDGSTLLGTATVVDGVAQLTIGGFSPGEHDVTAVYSGDDGNAGSASTEVGLAVAVPDIELVVDPDAADEFDGAPVDVSGHGLRADSEVEVFFDDDDSLGTVSVGDDGLVDGSVVLPDDIGPGEHEITVTGTAPDGSPVISSMTIFVDWAGVIDVSDAVGGYVGITPSRVLDTRDGQKLAARDVVEFTIPDALVADDVTAVVLNLAVTQPEARGHLTVFPCDTQRPLAATLNYGVANTISNLAIAGYASGDQLCVYSLSPAHVVVDINGYFRESAPDRFAKLEQSRLFDSRDAGVRVAGGETVEIDVIGDGLASAGTEAVNLYVASDQPVGRGFLTVFPCDAERPLAANLNFAAGQTIGNNVIAKVSDAGTVCVFARTDTHVVVDLHGMMHDDGVSQLNSLVPGRFIDTRDTGKIGARSELVVDFSDTVPAGTSAVELNVAATEAEGRGHFRIYPCGGELPLVASLNYPAGGSASGHVTATLSDAGTICIYTLSTTHIVVDVQGMQVVAD